MKKIKSYSTTRKTIKYRNYDIEYNIYGANEYTVQYCGDDFFFKTEKEAEKFIDTLKKEA